MKRIHPIYETFFGIHIDLSKIVAISPLEFLDKMGSGGWYVKFHIDIQLRDEPLIYSQCVTGAIPKDTWVTWEPSDKHGVAKHHAILTNGEKTTNPQEWIYDIQEGYEDVKVQFMVDTQKELDELIKVWKQYRNYQEK